MKSSGGRRQLSAVALGWPGPVAFRSRSFLKAIPKQSSSPARPLSTSSPRNDDVAETSSRLEDVQDKNKSIQAAPEIDLNAFGKLPPKERRVTAKTIPKLRVVPRSPSYFTAKPHYTDDLLMLRRVSRQYIALPRCKPGELPRLSVQSLGSYRAAVGNEPVRQSRYMQITSLVHRLNAIHPSVRPPAVVEAIRKFAGHVEPHVNRAKPILIDEFGRARAVGRRKSSIAQVWLVEGEGEVIVNGKTLSEAFGRVHDRESALWALKATDRVDKYNAWAIVQGGGTTGQAEALTLGVAKALLAHEPMLKPFLRKAGCITRDPRRVERKKHGRVKARKMPTWVKR